MIREFRQTITYSLGVSKGTASRGTRSIHIWASRTRQGLTIQIREKSETATIVLEGSEVKAFAELFVRAARDDSELELRTDEREERIEQ